MLAAQILTPWSDGKCMLHNCQIGQQNFVVAAERIFSLIKQCLVQLKD